MERECKIYSEKYIRNLMKVSRNWLIPYIFPVYYLTSGHFRHLLLQDKWFNGRNQ